MPNLEPKYLRYIYDCLEKVSSHTYNAYALPQGYNGLYLVQIQLDGAVLTEKVIFE